MSRPETRGPGETAACPACGLAFPMRPVLLNRVVRCTGCGVPFQIGLGGETRTVSAAAPGAQSLDAVAPSSTRRIRRQRQATQRILESMRAQVLEGIGAARTAPDEALAPATSDLPAGPALLAADPAAAAVAAAATRDEAAASDPPTRDFHASDAAPRRSRTQLAVARMRQVFLSGETAPPPPPAPAASGSAGLRHHGRDRVACPACNAVVPWQEGLVDLPLVCGACSVVFRVLEDGRALPYIANRTAGAAAEAAPRPQRSRTQLIRNTRSRLAGINEELRLLADAAAAEAEEPFPDNAAPGAQAPGTAAHPRTALLTGSGLAAQRRVRLALLLAGATGLLCVALALALLLRQPSPAEALRAATAGLDWRLARLAQSRQDYAARLLCPRWEQPVLIGIGSVREQSRGLLPPGGAAADPQSHAIQGLLLDRAGGSPWAGQEAARLPGGAWCLIAGEQGRLVLPGGGSVPRAWRAVVVRLGAGPWQVLAVQAADRDGRYPTAILPSSAVEP